VEDVYIEDKFFQLYEKGPECRAMIWLSLELYEALYREVVAKRTGRLAASTRIFTELEQGRWMGTLAVTAPYAASHEFGTDDGDERIIAGHHDLNKVLNIMARV
jgi:hypothetical protein